MLSIASPIALPLPKVCANCHVANGIISPTGGVHYKVCHSKSMVQKLGFLCGSTKDELVLLTIESK